MTAAAAPPRPSHGPSAASWESWPAERAHDTPGAADVALALLGGPNAASLGGAVVYAPGVEEAERWLAALRATRARRAPGTPWRVVPASVTPDRLDGALDVAATLATGAATRAAGLLAEASGGVLALPRAAAASLETARGWRPRSTTTRPPAPHARRCRGGHRRRRA
jgi:magnesium chelatase subunit D